MTIQYQGKFETQNTEFKALIRLYEEHEIKQTVTSFYRDALDGLNFSKSDDGDEAFKRDAKSRADTAIEALVALFQEYANFSSANSTEDFIWSRRLKGATSFPKELHTWTNDLLTKLHVGEGVGELCADSAEELRQLLEPYVRVPSGGGRSSCWPLIKNVKIGLRSSALLKRGIVLVDLPGLSDVNRIRTQTTQQFQRRCDLIFVVASSLRIESTPEVLVNLIHKGYAKTKKVLVCTKIDDLGSEASPSDLDATLEDQNDYNGRCEVLDRLDKRFTELSAELKSLKARRIRGPQMDASNGKLFEAKTRKERFGALKRQALIQMRKKQLVKRMGEIYRSNSRDGDPLKIHAVSNTEYLKYRVGDESDPITLTGDVIGIRDLRLCASTLPSKQHFERIWNYWMNTVPNLMYQLHLWRKQTTIPRRLELKHVVGVPLARSGDLWESFIGELYEQIDTVLVEGLRSQLDEWKQRGLDSHAKWQEVKALPFAAQSKNFGIPAGKNAEGDPWNDRLLFPVQEHEAPWKTLDRALVGVFNDAWSAWTGPLNQVEEAAKDFQGASGESLKLLQVAIRQKKAEIKDLVPKIRRYLKKKISTIHDMAMGTDPQGYLHATMEPAYRECELRAQQRGNGFTKDCRKIIERVVTNGSPYEAIVAGVKEDSSMAVEELKEKLKPDLQSIYEDLIADFDSMFVVEEETNEDRDVLVSNITGFIESTRPHLDGPLRDKLRRIIQESTETPPEHRQQRIDQVDLWSFMRT